MAPKAVKIRPYVYGVVAVGGLAALAWTTAGPPTPTAAPSERAQRVAAVLENRAVRPPKQILLKAASLAEGATAFGTIRLPDIGGADASAEDALDVAAVQPLPIEKRTQESSAGAAESRERPAHLPPVNDFVVAAPVLTGDPDVLTPEPQLRESSIEPVQNESGPRRKALTEISQPAEELPPVEIPVGRAWWDATVGRPIRADARPWEMDLDGLLMIALEHSDHVLAVSLEPEIRETEISRQMAQFDTLSFLDSKWNDLNDPVGNTLTTGGPSRYLDDHWFNKGGFKRLNWYGGQAELAQEMGLRNTNSVFFLPESQANMRLVMSYTQPLMRGRGRCYNESIVVLAQADTELARRDLERQLQEHFYQVAEAYWRLWLERARYLQQKDAAASTAKLLAELEGRREIDVLQSHILRARGAMAVRQAAVQRADLAVRNQETRLWAITGAPELHLSRATELVPQSLPSFELPPLDRDASVQEALQQRPEVTATLEKIRAAQTKLDVATHELMPALNLALQGYAHGLNGQFDVGRAFVNQFALGAPGYTAGIYYEAPIGNAAAQARLRRRQLEARQLALQFEATLKQVSADVDNSIRDIDAARATAHGQHHAMLAARGELDYLLARWRMMPGEDRATSLMMDEVLDALDRLVAAEGALAQAQVDYALALIQFKRATGQLFQVQRVGALPHPEILISRRLPGTGTSSRSPH